MPKEIVKVCGRPMCNAHSGRSYTMKGRRDRTAKSFPRFLPFALRKASRHSERPARILSRRGPQLVLHTQLRHAPRVSRATRVPCIDLPLVQKILTQPRYEETTSLGAYCLFHDATTEQNRRKMILILEGMGRCQGFEKTKSLRNLLPAPDQSGS